MKFVQPAIGCGDDHVLHFFAFRVIAGKAIDMTDIPPSPNDLVVNIRHGFPSFASTAIVSINRNVIAGKISQRQQILDTQTT